jgi:sugar lactone lactonase YvrE
MAGAAIDGPAIDGPVRTVADGLSFPEGPRWHQGALWFADIHGHCVYRLEPGGRPACVARFADRVSGLGFLPDGTLLAVSLLDRRLLAVGADGAVRLHADLSALSGDFINDMVVDAAGRAYVGSRNGGPPGSDSLILVTPDGRSRVVDDRMRTPNGSVVCDGGRTLIVAETQLGRLTRFAIQPDGSLADRAVLAELPGRHIDGICQDSAGAFWCGGGGHGLLYVAPDGASHAVRSFPGRMVLATALGGRDGRTLFLATTSTALLDNLGKVGADRTRDAAVSSDGRIEALQVTVPGGGTDSR